MKYHRVQLLRPGNPSHPVRGAWIEILCQGSNREYLAKSHPVRGAWIEMMILHYQIPLQASHPVRGAWIEIAVDTPIAFAVNVAPREGCVD